jgi:hypothetical protein
VDAPDFAVGGAAPADVHDAHLIPAATEPAEVDFRGDDQVGVEQLLEPADHVRPPLFRVRAQLAQFADQTEHRSNIAKFQMILAHEMGLPAPPVPAEKRRTGRASLLSARDAPNATGTRPISGRK